MIVVKMTANNKNLPVKKQSGGLVYKETPQTFEHMGFDYDVKEILPHIQRGLKPREAVKAAYPDVPAASYANITKKLRAHPYYLAAIEHSNDVLAGAAAPLQQNLLDIAFQGKSERNRLDATNSALDRIGIGAKEDGPKEPQYTFNFNFGQVAKPQIVDGDGKIIEGEVAS